MDDLRIKFSIIGHPKLEKLKLIVGNQAFELLVTLWIRVAQNRPHGNLKELDNVDIALYAGWKGDPEEFVEALKKCKWIKDNGNGLEIQDWREHQPWVFFAPERSERARQAAHAKWGTKPQRAAQKTRSERMRVAKSKGNHTKAEWEEMMIFFGVCVKCEGESGLVCCDRDHIIPVYQGGSHGINNIQPLCAKCNASKGPDNTDYRLLFCEKRGIEMPAKWMQPAGISLALTSAPSPNPSPNPKPTPKAKKNKKFIPPKLKDVIQFFTENKYTEESAIQAFKYYADGDPPWTDSRGNQVRGWKQKMRGVWFKPENIIKKKGNTPPWL